MTAKAISGFSVGLLTAACIIAVLLGNGLADQSYPNPYYSQAPQNAQQREMLFKAILADDKNISQFAPVVGDPYKALQNPYTFVDPQNALVQADDYKSIQKLNSIGQGPASVDNWYYWSNMWLDQQEPNNATYAVRGPGDLIGVPNVYGAMENPFAYKDPQATLERANAYKSIQKLNSLYQGPTSADNWYYWSNAWLSEP